MGNLIGNLDARLFFEHIQFMGLAIYSSLLIEMSEIRRNNCLEWEGQTNSGDLVLLELIWCVHVIEIQGIIKQVICIIIVWDL